MKKFKKQEALEDFLSYAKQKYGTYGEPTWLRVYNDWLAEEITVDALHGANPMLDPFGEVIIKVQHINDYLEDA